MLDHLTGTVVLVTGGRNYTDMDRVFATLDRIQPRPELVIEGGCPTGADHQCRRWAESRGVHALRVDALWRAYATSAGPRRNSMMVLVARMLREDGADVRAVAFPGGAGTADCTRKAREAGLVVVEVTS